MYTRAKSSDRSRATRSPCRSATSPESAALNAVTRPVSLPCPNARSRGRS